MHWTRVISTIDAHAAGEPLRIITSGVPPLPGSTVLERRLALQRHHDDLRRLLLFEPRGHADMYGAILTPPDSDAADYGVIFLTNEGYSTMCGHGIIALTTALIETGMFPRSEPETVIRYDAPAGRIDARATIRDGRIERVAFVNVPAYQLGPSLTLNFEGIQIDVAVAWGGAFYALVDGDALDVSIDVASAPLLVELGMAIKRRVSAQLDVEHPGDSRLSGLYGTIISGRPKLPGSHGRNVTIYADGAIDRSPCGTGTSAKLAVLFTKGDIAIGEPYIHESIIDTVFEGVITGETTVDGQPAVQTDISGRGAITGFHQFVLDRDDPLQSGFLVR
jgi:proline racemase